MSSFLTECTLTLTLSHKERELDGTLTLPRFQRHCLEISQLFCTVILKGVQDLLFSAFLNIKSRFFVAPLRQNDTATVPEGAEISEGERTTLKFKTPIEPAAEFLSKDDAILK